MARSILSHSTWRISTWLISNSKWDILLCHSLVMVMNRSFLPHWTFLLSCKQRLWSLPDSGQESPWELRNVVREWKMQIYSLGQEEKGGQVWVKVLEFLSPVLGLWKSKWTGNSSYPQVPRPVFSALAVITVFMYNWVYLHSAQPGIAFWEVNLRPLDFLVVFIGPYEKTHALGILKNEEEDLDDILRKRLKDSSEIPGALWHIYAGKDVDKIREFLQKVYS